MPRSGESWDPARLSGRPEFEPFSHLLAPLAAADAFPSPGDLTRLVERSRSERTPELSPLRFVASAPRPRRHKRGSPNLGELYDTRIARDGEVPCFVHSYHDLFNAVMFAAFPRAKRALHARQHRALLGWVDETARTLPGQRTREQDALTLFDEGGSVLLCPTRLRPHFQAGKPLPLHAGAASPETARLVVFGHALLEHLSSSTHPPVLRSGARVLWISDETLSLAPGGLLERVDHFVTDLIEDRGRFTSPDADAVVEWRAEDEGEPVAHAYTEARARRSSADASAHAC